MGQPAGKSASARHLAAAAILLLKKYNIPDPALNLAAGNLWARGHDNAFFAFLAGDPSDKVNDLIGNACPYLPNSGRFQWVWERSVIADESPNTMYWDCIFAANLALNGLKHTAGAFGARLTDLLPPIARKWTNVKTGVEDLGNIIKAVADEKGRLQDEAKSLQNQFDYLKRVLPAIADKSIPHINRDGSVTLPAAPVCSVRSAPAATIGGKKGVTISDRQALRS